MRRKMRRRETTRQGRRGSRQGSSFFHAFIRPGLVFSGGSTVSRKVRAQVRLELALCQADDHGGRLS
eukprot:613000-Hanusia_phi.AAC.1